jgi:hypothetical protein
MKTRVDTFPEVPRIGDVRRNERRVIGPFGFHDCSMIQLGSRAKVSKIFRRVRGRPHTFKTTLRKFEFFSEEMRTKCLEILCEKLWTSQVHVCREVETE